MLIYHPAFDAYHCVFRMLLITQRIASVELAKLRIIDFYYCFPAELQNVSLPAEHSKARGLAKAAKNPYHGPVSVTRTFRDMEHLQIAAAHLLVASKVFNAERLQAGIVERATGLSETVMFDSINHTIESQDEIHEYILNSFSEIPLLGEKGLKRRTGLMEYRYDAA